MVRYSRQIQLKDIGMEGQKKISNARIAIVGLGGLGCPSALYLAGAGVGYLKVIDFDTVSLQNLHRQPVYTEDQIGKEKATSLVNHLARLNSSIEIEAINEKLTPENATYLLSDVDIVLDCSDNLESRYLINDACVKLNKPFVSAAIYKYEGQLSVFNYRNGPSYRCLYPVPEDLSKISSCQDDGVLGTLPSMMGSMQANETLKIILESEDILSGKILITSILNYDTSTFAFNRDEENFNSIRQAPLQSILDNNEVHSLSISWSELSPRLLSERVQFIDIRDNHEIPKLDSPMIKCFPSNEGLPSLKEMPDNTISVVFCQNGLRSLTVTGELRSIYNGEIYSLEGGVENLLESGLFNVYSELSQ